VEGTREGAAGAAVADHPCPRALFLGHCVSFNARSQLFHRPDPTIGHLDVSCGHEIGRQFPEGCEDKLSLTPSGMLTGCLPIRLTFSSLKLSHQT
jgi:hypothetical protein